MTCDVLCGGLAHLDLLLQELGEVLGLQQLVRCNLHHSKLHANANKPDRRCNAGGGGRGMTCVQSMTNLSDTLATFFLDTFLRAGLADGVGGGLRDYRV